MTKIHLLLKRLMNIHVLEQHIQANGKVASVTEEAQCVGKMAPPTKENGKITEPTAKEFSSTQQVTNTKDNGSAIELMDMALITVKMEEVM